MKVGKYLQDPGELLVGLVQTLYVRPDLAGVSRLAEALDESVRWCA